MRCYGAMTPPKRSASSFGGVGGGGAGGVRRPERSRGPDHGAPEGRGSGGACRQGSRLGAASGRAGGAGLGILPADRRAAAPGPAGAAPADPRRGGLVLAQEAADR